MCIPITRLRVISGLGAVLTSSSMISSIIKSHVLEKPSVSIKRQDDQGLRTLQPHHSIISRYLLPEP